MHALLHTILMYRLDAALLGVTMLAVAGLLSRGLRARHGQGLGPRTWAGLGVLVLLALSLAELAGQHERGRLKDMLIGIAPTYAYEIQRMGHADITLDTPADDPSYLRMIRAQIDWERLNPNVADIYTYRVNDAGEIFLIVDSETDYDRDGVYDEDREQRTEIGEPYMDADTFMSAVMDGVAVFDDEMYSDRWGTWVSAYVPMHDAQGNIEAALGVDYHASQWLVVIMQSRLAALALVSIVGAIVLASSMLLLVTRAELDKRALLELEQKRLQEQLVALIAQRAEELERDRQKDKLRLEHLEDAVAQRTAELRDLAHNDPLTGLPNRACFYERLLSAVRRSRCEAGYQYAVLYLDFDRFKIINDSLGHGMGDRLLRMIGTRLAEAVSSASHPTLGQEPMPARLGGDEFCILLEGFGDRAAVQAFAERVLARLSEPYPLEGRSIASGLSMGIAFQHPDYQHAEDVLRDADLAMYAAKTAGRGRAVVFTPHMHEQAMHRMVIEQDLRDAAPRGQLTLFLQPTVSLQTRRVLGAEALLRWRHPQRGMIGPGDFIPLAEETGIIHALGLWVFEETCRLLKRLPTLGYLGFNVSPLQLTQSDFLPRLQRLLDEHQPDPRRLVCEVTESVLTECPDTALRAIDWMHHRGIRVFLDDFGSGVSSLGTLRRFPLDGIKLDRSFLDQNVFERRTAAVIQSAVRLAHDLGIDLIAEGVEVVEQAALLQALHCDAAQGYLFSQPLPVEDFLRMLTQETHRAVA